MPGPYCAVGLCKNSKNKNPDLSFHRFPKDKNLLQEWRVKCNREDDFNVSQSYVCSEHFDSEMFQEDMRAKIMNLPRRRVLIQGAVPKYKLRGIDDTPRETLRSKRMRLKKNQEEHNAIIREILSNPSEEREFADEPHSECHIHETVLLKSESDLFVSENVIFCEKDSEPFSHESGLNSPIYEPLIRKNVLLDERRFELHNHYESIKDYQKLYEELLQKYELRKRENGELIRKNEELQKLVEEAKRHNLT